MSSSPMLSPDGRWRWDGRSWVPNAATPRPKGPMPSLWVALITIGSIALLLLGGVGLVGATALAQSVQRNFGFRSTTTCMPSDFPVYPNTDRVFAYAVGPICTEGYTSTDTKDQVLTFYDGQLANDPWRIVRSPDPNTILFGRTDNRNASGEVQAFPERYGARLTITYSP